MNVIPLTPNAESIRNEIKTLVTNNASVAFEDDSGKKYYSLAIVTAVKQLAIELGVYYTVILHRELLSKYRTDIYRAGASLCGTSPKRGNL